MEMYNGILDNLKFMKGNLHKVPSYDTLTDDVVENSITLLENAVRYDVTNVKNYMHSNYDSYADMVINIIDLSILAPPYPNMYLELGNIAGILESTLTGNECPDDYSVTVGAYLDYKEVSEFSQDPLFLDICKKYDIKWITGCRLFFNFGTSSARCIKSRNYSFYITSRGKNVTHSKSHELRLEIASDIAKLQPLFKNIIGFPVLMLNERAASDKDMVKDAIGVLEYLYSLESDNQFTTVCNMIVFMALTFMHCKNVEIEERDTSYGIPNKILKKRIRHDNFVPLKYHVIKIIPFGKKSKTSEGLGDGGKHSLHICRGHFKDYTKGKGLFGKYKGLYWWDDCTKGDIANGVVDKHYEVE
jgi:hypothetical protein